MVTPGAKPGGGVTARRRGGRRRRVTLGILGGLAVLVALGLGFAPTLASTLGRGYAQDAIDGVIPGSVRLERWSLSWFGPQRVGPLTILDPGGNSVATVTIETPARLTQLLRGDYSLGAVRVTGEADIIAGADGTTNLERALGIGRAAGARPGSSGAGGSGPRRLPVTLSGTVRLERARIAYTDPRLKLTPHAPGGTIVLPNTTGSADFAVGRPFDGSLSAEALAGAGRADARTPVGTLDANWTIAHLTDATGLLTPGSASVDVSADLKGLSVALADSIAGQEGRLEAILGPQVTVHLAAKGTSADLTADVTGSSRAVTVDVGLRYTPAAIEFSRPGTIEAATEGLAALAPGIITRTPDAAGAMLAVDAWPRVQVTVQSMRVPLAGSSPDIARASVRATLRAGGAAGRIAVASGEQGVPRVVSVKTVPLTATLETKSLAEGVRLTGATSVEMDGHKAGDLTVDLTAANLGKQGSQSGPGGPFVIDFGGATLEGVAAISGFDTRVAQPFVQAMGVSLAQDVGPEVDVELTAAARQSGGSSLPETSIELRVSSQNIAGEAELALDGGVVRTTGGGVKVEVRNAGPLVTRLGQQRGLRIQSGMPVRLTAADVHVDLSRALRLGERFAGEAGPDLRGSGGTVELWVGPTTGAVLLATGGPARVFRLSETTATVETRNLAQGINLGAHFDADIDGKPSGTIDAALAVSGLLDDSGAARSMPAGPIRGRIAGQNLPTALVQTLVPALATARVDLPTDLGPSADVVVLLIPRQGDGAVAGTDIELTVRSEKVTAGGVVALDGGVLRSGKEPLSITMRSPGQLVTRWLPAGFEAGPAGSVTATIRGLAIPLRPILDPLAATGRVDVDLRALGLRAAAGAPLEVGSVAVSVEATGAGPVKVEVDGALRQGGQAFTVKGSVQLDGLLAQGADGHKRLTVASVRPSGVLAITDAPVSLLSWMPAAPAVPGNEAADPRELVALIQGVAGPSVSVDLTMTPVKGTAGTDVRLATSAAHARMNLAATVMPREFTLRESKGDIDLTPAGVATLMEWLPSSGQARPRVRAPAKLSFTLAGVAIPRGAGLPDLSRAGALAWTASMPGRLQIESLADATTAAGRAGPIGLEALTMSGSVPLGALAGEGVGDLNAVVTGRLIGGSKGGSQKLDARFAARMHGGRPEGAMSAGLKVNGLDTRWVDAVAARPGLASGLVGEAVDVDVAFSAEFAPASSGEDATMELRNGSVTAAVASPTFSMSSPATVLIRPDRFELSKATIMRATVSAEWANELILAHQAAGQEGPPRPLAASFAGPAEVSLNIPALVVARGDGPMKPGVFSGKAIVDVPSVPMMLGDGPAEFTDVHAEVAGGQKPGVVGFSLTMLGMHGRGEKGAGGASEPIRFGGGLYGVCDEAGRPTLDTARITATGKAARASTAVIDALARQNGLLLELLGPTVSLDMELGGFSRTSGKISATAVSPRARASIKGTVQDSVLVASEPMKVEFTEITPALGSRLVRGLPLVGTFEKRPDDGPAVLTARNLEAPLDHDLSRFSGDIDVDFGRARFETGKAFSAILKVVRANSSGEIGRRLAPLTLTVRNGVVSYDRYALPLGEFSVDTQGKVDLANRTLDVLTYIPLGALTDEAAGVFNTGLGRLLGGAVPLIEKATMVPWRTRGSLDNPTTTPDLGLFLENTGRTILSPGSDLFKRLEDLLGGGTR